MLAKRIIPCLDVKDGRVVKGTSFVSLRDAGDPVECAAAYSDAGADELVFLDITATLEARATMRDIVASVAERISIPFTVGGGIGSTKDVSELLEAGADKVSINTAAVRSRELVREAAEAFGCQCIVVGMQVKRVGPRAAIPSGYEIYVEGARTATARDALHWALMVQKLGAGEICLNSIDADGTKAGYDLEITRLISEAVHIPVIASGGAGEPEHLRQVLDEGKADAALIASMAHFGTHTIEQIKRHLAGAGVPMRLKW